MLPEVPADRTLFQRMADASLAAELALRRSCWPTPPSARWRSGVCAARERLEAEYAGARNIFDGRHADRNVASRGRARQQIQTMFGRHHAPVP